MANLQQLIGKGLFGLVYRLFLSPLRKYPGPKLWAVSQLPLQLAQLDGTIERKLLDFHEQYGPTVRIGPTDLSYANDQVFRDVFAIRNGHQEFMKWNENAPPNGVKGILLAERNEHARYRKLLSHAFSERGLREQESRVMTHVDLLIARLHQKASTGPQDMVQWLNWTTFDLIGDLAFGESFDCLEKSRHHYWINAVFGNIKAIVLMRFLVYMGLGWLIPHIAPKGVEESRAMNEAYSVEKIRRRLQVSGPRGDLFDHVLQKKASEGGMTEAELVSNAANIVLGGSETTATLLSGTLFLLIQHPHILEKVQQEVRSAFTDDEQITIVGVNKLSFMLAVLQEAMRLYPPVPVLNPRIVPAGGDSVDGALLPGGTNIVVSTYAANRFSMNFARPHEFVPGRWALDKEDKQVSEFANDNTAAFQPFSAGTRNCIGRNLAYAEMRLILAKLLYNFEIMRPDDGSFQSDWMSRQRTWILWEKSPLWIKLVPHISRC